MQIPADATTTITIKPQLGQFDSARMLTIKQVMKLWPVSRQWLNVYTNLKRGAERIPSYKVAGKRLYRYDELIFWLDNHKSEDKERRGKSLALNE